ncbi:hypothetical protein GCM10010994_18400 [Chelatococcus reniformis]|uniref:Tetracyclin repressor-like C-terminal domain-containing protein n=1 Tax=Chelatococcus reniformis TaxID=1494448 RepID=A0A916XCA5_9HYPH|nr:hypothetical protein GCM10010994_18400 [Chelatococcus reniformis]
MRDLSARMGMTGASLYNAFGDKRALFGRALASYVTSSFGARARRFEHRLPGRAAIEAFFAEIIAVSLADSDRKGCLLINSALEVAPHDDEFQRLIAGVLAEIEAFFRRCVTAGQKDGSISTAQPADDLARLLLGVHLGIRVLARARPERDLLEGMLRPALAMLEPAGQFTRDASHRGE